MSATVAEVTFSGPDLINIVADPGTPAYPSPPHRTRLFDTASPCLYATLTGPQWGQGFKPDRRHAGGPAGVQWVPRAHAPIRARRVPALSVKCRRAASSVTHAAASPVAQQVGEEGGEGRHGSLVDVGPGSPYANRVPHTTGRLCSP
jgi:hypothetical protein